MLPYNRTNIFFEKYKFPTDASIVIGRYTIYPIYQIKLLLECKAMLITQKSGNRYWVA